MKREINVDFSTIFRLTKPAFFNYFSSVQFFFSVRKEGWSGQPKQKNLHYRHVVSVAASRSALKTKIFPLKQISKITCLIQGHQRNYCQRLQACLIFNWLHVIADMLDR